jgi:hypothetical protein
MKQISKWKASYRLLKYGLYAPKIKPEASTMLGSDDSPQKVLLALARVMLDVEVELSSRMVLSLKLLTEGGGVAWVSRVISKWYLKYSSKDATRLEAKLARTETSSLYEEVEDLARTLV